MWNNRGQRGKEKRPLRVFLGYCMAVVTHKNCTKLPLVCDNGQATRTKVYERILFRTIESTFLSFFVSAFTVVDRYNNNPLLGLPNRSRLVSLGHFTVWIRLLVLFDCHSNWQDYCKGSLLLTQLSTQLTDTDLSHNYGQKKFILSRKLQLTVLLRYFLGFTDTL